MPSVTDKLTPAKIERHRAQLVAGEKLILRDHGRPGFALVLYKRSAGWWFTYRAIGSRKLQHMKLGELSVIDLQLARAVWARKRADVAEGRDPRAEAKAAVEVKVEERKKERTLAEFLDDYLCWFDDARCARRPRPTSGGR